MPGIRDAGALESCLAQPRMAFSGADRFATVEAKAAAYCFFIVRNHPFFDGNKRTGFLATLHFLRINGVSAEFDEDETYDVITRVASGALEFDDLVAAFRDAMSRHAEEQSDSNIND